MIVNSVKRPYHELCDSVNSFPFGTGYTFQKLYREAELKLNLGAYVGYTRFKNFVLDG